MLNTINTASPQAVSDTQLGEEVHEEGTVEVFAHLVEHKPVSQFAVINESPNLFHLCGSLEVSVHPHVDHMEP